MMILLFLLFFNTEGHAQSNETLSIVCSGGNCQGSRLTNSNSDCNLIQTKSLCEENSLNNLCSWRETSDPNGGICSSIPILKNCSLYNCSQNEYTYSAIKPRGVLDFNLSIGVSSTDDPKSVGVSITNKVDFNVVGNNEEDKLPIFRDAQISLQPQKKDGNSGSLILIGNYFNNLVINLNGYNGKTGKSASEICSENYTNGVYGPDAAARYAERRTSESSNPISSQEFVNKCDSDDFLFLQNNKFTCDYGYQEIFDPSVMVKKIVQKEQCQASAQISYCADRMVSVTCDYSLWSPYKEDWLTVNDLENPSYVEGPIIDGEFVMSKVPPIGTGFTGVITGGLNWYRQVKGSYTCQNKELISVYSSGTRIVPYNSCISSGLTSCNSYCQISSGCSVAAAPANYSGENLKGFMFSSNGRNFCHDKPNGTTELPAFNSTEQLYRRISTAPPKKLNVMPLSYNNVFIGEYRESFVQKRAQELGGMAGFCHEQRWNAIPVPNGYNSKKYWAGIGSNGSPLLINGVESEGIPFESTNYITKNVQWRTEFSKNSNGQNPREDTNLKKARTSYWKGKGGRYTELQPGLNEDGTALASGSKWFFKIMPVFEPCTDFWHETRRDFETLIDWHDVTTTSQCANSKSEKDPYNKANWISMGRVFDPAGEMSEFSCNPDNCSQGITVSTSIGINKSISLIEQTSGESGTLAGKGYVFINDAKTIDAQSFNGSGGNIGSANVPLQEQPKMCVRIEDGNSNNVQNHFSPSVNYRFYNWKAVDVLLNGNSGATPTGTDNEIIIFKKLDPALRYYLDNQLL